MENCFERQAELANSGRKYAQSEAPEKNTESTPTAQRGVQEGRGSPGGEPPPTERGCSGEPRLQKNDGAGICMCIAS
jgi:hypothetical protein